MEKVIDRLGISQGQPVIKMMKDVTVGEITEMLGSGRISFPDPVSVTIDHQGMGVRMSFIVLDVGLPPTLTSLDAKMLTYRGIKVNPDCMAVVLDRCDQSVAFVEPPHKRSYGSCISGLTLSAKGTAFYFDVPEKNIPRYDPRYPYYLRAAELVKVKHSIP